jgi:hypothetical protein
MPTAFVKRKSGKAKKGAFFPGGRPGSSVGGLGRVLAPGELLLGLVETAWSVTDEITLRMLSPVQTSRRRRATVADLVVVDAVGERMTLQR